MAPFLGYAAAHGGRGPGSASYPDSSVAWQDIINTEWYRAWMIPRIIGQTAGSVPKNVLLCASYRYWPGAYCSRPYQLSRDVTGGPNWATSGYPVWGPYGKNADPNNVNYMYPARATGLLSYYTLGAEIEKFKRPTAAYMLIESEYYNDVFGGPPSSITLTQAQAKWATPDLQLSFRHTLPTDVTAYQKNATTVIGYIDGRVTYLFATGDILEPARWTMAENNK